MGDSLVRPRSSWIQRIQTPFMPWPMIGDATRGPSEWQAREAGSTKPRMRAKPGAGSPGAYQAGCWARSGSPSLHRIPGFSTPRSTTRTRRGFRMRIVSTSSFRARGQVSRPLDTGFTGRLIGGNPGAWSVLKISASGVVRITTARSSSTQIIPNTCMCWGCGSGSPGMGASPGHFEFDTVETITPFGSIRGIRATC